MTYASDSVRPEGSRLKIHERGTLVADVPNRGLTDEAPVYRRPMQVPPAATMESTSG